MSTLRINYDAAFCGRIPLHLTNSIQPHGVLLVVDRTSFIIVQVSQNASSWLGIPLHDILLHPLEEFAEDQTIISLKAKLKEQTFERSVLMEASFNINENTKTYLCLLHEKDDCLMLEVDHQHEHSTQQFTSTFQRVQNFMDAISKAKTVKDIAQVACKEIKQLSSFDKVMIYQFDEEWNGLVIGEEMERDMERYLGLKYPASDIPKQARELYYRTPYRFIPDRDYIAVPLEPQENPASKATTDLSETKLRSVLPVHLEYLKNMNVMASMSTRIIHKEKLWGLIACHHKTSKHLSFEECTMFEFFSHVVSAKLSSVLNHEAWQRQDELQRIFHSVHEQIRSFDNPAHALTVNESQLLSLLSADGVAVIWHDDVHLLGNTPDHQQVEIIKGWLQEKNYDHTVHIHAFPKAYEAAKDFADVASGLLILPIQPYEGKFIVAFRAEAIRKISWGGNPDEVITFGESKADYHPRKSFEIWKETVRHSSIPWTPEEILVAERLRTTVVEHTLRSLALSLEKRIDERTQQLAVSKKDLEQMYSELMDITHVTSHDLKEPIRKISIFATKLELQLQDAEHQKAISRILTSASKATQLIDALVNFSDLSRNGVMHETNLNETLEHILKNLAAAITEKNITIKTSPLPTVQGIRPQLQQLFYILINNAIKFSKEDSDNEISIGCQRVASLSMDAAHHPQGKFYRIEVRDQGIGFNPAFSNKLFKIFETLHPSRGFEGTGINLAIAKKIVERHKGIIVGEGRPGDGAVFTIILPATQEEHPTFFP